MTAHLSHLLTLAAEESPDRVALVEADSGRRVTWAELNAEVDQVAQGLNALGLVAGYRVVIAMANRVEFVTTYLGALRARLVAVPVNPRAATGELVRMVADCGARVVVADALTVTSVRAAVAGLQDALEGADDDLRSRTAVPRVVVTAIRASFVPSIAVTTTRGTAVRERRSSSAPLSASWRPATAARTLVTVRASATTTPAPPSATIRTSPAGRGAGVHRHGHQPGPQGTEVGRHELDPVRHRDHDPVARDETQRVEALRHLVDLGVQLGPGDPPSGSASTALRGPVTPPRPG